MPWLSPSIKLIETFLESKRNEPLPPTLVYLSCCLFSSLLHRLSVSISFYPSALSSVSRSTFSFAVTPPFTRSILPSYSIRDTRLSFHHLLCFSSIATCNSTVSVPATHPSFSAFPPLVTTPTASLMSMLLSRHSENGVLLLSIRIAACFSIEIFGEGNFDDDSKGSFVVPRWSRCSRLIFINNKLFYVNA